MQALETLSSVTGYRGRPHLVWSQSGSRRCSLSQSEEGMGVAVPLAAPNLLNVTFEEGTHYVAFSRRAFWVTAMFKIFMCGKPGAREHGSTGARKSAFVERRARHRGLADEISITRSILMNYSM
jgi:hypothetical protein